MREQKRRKNLVLLKELVRTDFRLRYQGSVLGYAWALIRPLMMFAILYVVFAKMLKFGDAIPHYPVYLLTGTVLWNFFTECTGQGIRAIEQRGDLIRKINFPKYIIVVSATATAVINLLINLIVLVVFASISGVKFSIGWLVIPVLLAELYVLALGISLLLGAMHVKYRDVISIWEVLTQAMFYAVPIIYPVSMLTEASSIGAKILLTNPVAQVIQDVRYFLITPETITIWQEGWIWGIGAVAIVVVILIVGALYFKQKSKYFAEEV